MTRAIVPLKDLLEAKTRLSGLLAPRERRALAQAMVEDVIAALAHCPGIDAVTLVSDDPCAPLFAGRYGLEWQEEGALKASGLNGILEEVCRHKLRGGAKQLLVMHADLPLVTARELSTILDNLSRRGGLVIGCDRHRAGTNLLAFGRDWQPQFAFGPGSLARHRDQARSAGVPWRVLKLPGTGLDVDEPADLAELLARLGDGEGGATGELLRGTALGARLRLALAPITGISAQRIMAEGAND